MKYKTIDVKNMYKIIERTKKDSIVRKAMQNIVQDYNTLYAEYSNQQEEIKRYVKILAENERLHNTNKNKELLNNKLKAKNEKLERKIIELEKNKT